MILLLITVFPTHQIHQIGKEKTKKQTKKKEKNKISIKCKKKNKKKKKDWTLTLNKSFFVRKTNTDENKILKKNRVTNINTLIPKNYEEAMNPEKADK